MINATLLRLAARNVFRQKIRTLATLSAIAIGVAGLILAGGFVKDIFVQLGEAIIHSQSGHIQVSQSGFYEGKNRAPEAFFLEDAESLKTRIKNSHPAVDAVMARLQFSGVLNNGRRDLGIIGEGIEPDPENVMGSYLNYIEGRALKGTDLDGIVVGQGVAKSLGLAVGDRVTLVMTLSAGAVNTLDFEIVGVFQSFSKEFDARAVRIPLNAAQSLMDTNAVHLLVATLTKTDFTTPATQALTTTFSTETLSVASWHELSDFYDKTVDLYDRQFGVLRLIILLMVLLSVANSVNMSLFERTREFGTMLALGDQSKHVFKLILTESFCLGAIGALSGMLLGCGLALMISAIGIPMPPPPNANLGYIAQIRLTPNDVLIAGTIGFIACIGAAILPAKRAADIDIVDALRHGA